LVVGILASLLVCTGPARGDAAEWRSAPTLHFGELSLTLWQPGDSYQSGPQFDGRLDKPVQSWHPGTPLRDILADLTQQTGVHFDFVAPDKDEPRLCVTLYLHPQRPPSLREVMTQLGWATGCTFAYAECRPEGKVYYLLWSSVGEGTARELDAQREQFRADWQTGRDAQRQVAASVLEEAEAGLALSREEAVARYHGKNDALLLNLLDPARRAALGFFIWLSEADTKELFSGQRLPLSRGWSAWSAEQQAALAQALGLDKNRPPDGTVSIMVSADFGGLLVATTQNGPGGADAGQPLWPARQRRGAGRPGDRPPSLPGRAEDSGGGGGGPEAAGEMAGAVGDDTAGVGPAASAGSGGEAGPVPGAGILACLPHPCRRDIRQRPMAVAGDSGEGDRDACRVRLLLAAAKHVLVRPAAEGSAV
jgi:hypothetical protein